MVIPILKHRCVLSLFKFPPNPLDPLPICFVVADEEIYQGAHRPLSGEYGDDGCAPDCRVRHLREFRLLLKIERNIAYLPAVATARFWERRIPRADTKTH